MIKTLFCNFFLTVSVILLICFILFIPDTAALSARQGLESCLSLIPYLFPYIAVGEIISRSVIGEYISKILSPLTVLFRLPKSLATSLALGLISGFPVSAVCAAKTYGDRLCTKEEACRLICFASNPSPSFVIALAGGMVLSSTAAGAILYLCQTLAFFTSGILFGLGKGSKNTPQSTEKAKCSLPETLTQAVSGAVSSIIIICGFIVFFSFISGFVCFFFQNILIRLDENSKNIISTLIKGIFEMGTGVSSAKLLPTSLRLVSLCFIMGFGGLSALFQIIAVSRDINLSLSYYLTSKLINILFMLMGALLITYLNL